MSIGPVDKSECTRRTIFPSVEIATAAGREMMISYVTFDPGAIVEEHSHPHEQVGTVLEGRARFIVDGRESVLGPGDGYIIPGGIPHKVIALDERVVAFDVFHPIREDYL
jgi:quercetin dioxygenase-like cupin family protein